MSRSAAALLLLSVAHVLPTPAGASPMECERVANPAGRSTAGIEETFHGWRRAVAAGDLDGITSLVTEDAEFWTHEQPTLRGRSAVREAFSRTLERWRWEQEFRCRELIVGDGWALARGTEVNRLEPRDGGDPVVQRQRAFSVLRREEDGVWRFARGMTNGPPPEG